MKWASFILAWLAAENSGNKTLSSEFARAAHQFRMRLHRSEGTSFDQFFHAYQTGEDAVRASLEEGNNIALVQADRFVQLPGLH